MYVLYIYIYIYQEQGIYYCKSYISVSLKPSKIYMYICLYMYIYMYIYGYI